MRVLVCGSRDFTDYHLIDEALEGLRRSKSVSVLIEGGALGADRFARYWAAAHDIPIETYNAAWVQRGQSAGPQRNARMLREGKPDLVLAFINKPIEQSRGTFNMVLQARRSGVPVSIIEDHA